MKNGYSIPYWAMLLVLTGGCASMSGDECLTGDWRTIGYEDGLQGHTADRIGEYRRDCAKHGVAPDLDEYNAGRQQGLVEFCEPGNAFRVGDSGRAYNGVCHAHREAEFLDAYNAGLRLHSLRADVNRAESAIATADGEIDRIDRTIADTESRIVADETSADERIALLLELKNLAERRGQVETELARHREDRARAQLALDHYRQVLADIGY